LLDQEVASNVPSISLRVKDYLPAAENSVQKENKVLQILETVEEEIMSSSKVS
jgi:hypothetical protein